MKNLGLALLLVFFSSRVFATTATQDSTYFAFFNFRLGPGSTAYGHEVQSVTAHAGVQTENLLSAQHQIVWRQVKDVPLLLNWKSQGFFSKAVFRSISTAHVDRQLGLAVTYRIVFKDTHLAPLWTPTALIPIRKSRVFQAAEIPQYRNAARILNNLYHDQISAGATTCNAVSLITWN